MSITLSPASQSATRARCPDTATPRASPGVSRKPTSTGAVGSEMSITLNPEPRSATRARSPDTTTPKARPGVSRKPTSARHCGLRDVYYS